VSLSAADHSTSCAQAACAPGAAVAHSGSAELAWIAAWARGLLGSDAARS
jgi:hypothetical protein